MPRELYLCSRGAGPSVADSLEGAVHITTSRLATLQLTARCFRKYPGTHQTNSLHVEAQRRLHVATNLLGQLVLIFFSCLRDDHQLFAVFARRGKGHHVTLSDTVDVFDFPLYRLGVVVSAVENDQIFLASRGRKLRRPRQSLGRPYEAIPF